MATRVTGIIWVGPVYDWSGYGTVSRNYLKGLAKESLPVRVVSVGPKCPKELGPRTVSWIRSLEGVDVGKYPIVIINLTPDSYPEIWTLGAVKRIGVSCFETDRIPAHWVKLCKSVEEIWVPGQFNVDTYSRSGVPREKIWAVPYAVDTDEYNPSLLPKRPAEREPFTFLYIFSFGWRKGFDILLEAFMNEFKKGEARLILRSYTAGYQGVERDQQRQVMLGSVKDEVDFSRADLPEVEIIDQSLSPQQMRELYSRADLYISTDRANGWGYPCMEAMAMGIPASTIDGSGTMGFMNKDNSLLIEPTGRQEPVDPRLSDAQPRLYGGHKWAEVEVGEVRRVMRWAATHPKELKVIADRGASDINAHFTPEKIAPLVTEHIKDYQVGGLVKVMAALHLSGKVARVTIIRDMRDFMVRNLKKVLR